MQARTTRSTKGQGFIEVAIGGMVLIPLALGMLDLGVLLTTNSLNDAAAKNAARSAANEQNSALAYAAATQALAAFKPSNMCTISLGGWAYNSDRVSVTTKVDVKLPVPFPGFSEQILVAQATEPVIAQ